MSTATGLHVLPDPRSEPVPGEFGPLRPSLLTVRPADDGLFSIHVAWSGRECILRAVVVRRLLAERGLEARSGDSQDGRMWELRVEGVPADRVAKLIDEIIW